MPVTSCCETQIHNIIGEHLLPYGFAQAGTLPHGLEAFGGRKRGSSPISPDPFASIDRIEQRATLTSNSTKLNGANGNPPPNAAVTVRATKRQTTPSPPSPPRSHLGPDTTPNGTTLKAQTDSNVQWTLPQIITQLNTYRQDIKDGHVRLTKYILESTKATDRRVRHGADLFASLKAPLNAEKNASTMRIKYKQHLKGKRDQREAHYTPACIKTNKDRVPSYRFHHVAIKKNVLTPNTMLTFVPHLRDLESSEETKYNSWLNELEDIDLKSGFTPMNREDKQQLTVQGERAATVSLYLDTWLDDMAIPGCNKSALISYMAAREPDYTITPQQKTDMLNSHHNVEDAAPRANKAAQMFTDAFQHVFEATQPPSKQIELRRVLMLGEVADNILDSEPIAKDATSPQPHDEDEDEDEVAESNLATYCILGCLICFSHSCDHGEYDNKNMKRTFSLSSWSHLSDDLKNRRRGIKSNRPIHIKPCTRQCYQRTADHVRIHLQPRPWSDDERIVLRSLFTTASHSRYKGDPICLAAEFLNRNCDEVHTEYTSLKITLPQPEPADTPRVKKISWYDRQRKVLIGDWQDHTTTHAHQQREISDPCSHEGPCVAGACTCVDGGVLCEKFCRCTVDNCAYKFTGCGCHSQGKTCLDSKKEKPCICVQLNRECDPQLCDSCGALERADSLNEDNTEIHSTGCQNCDLQRGVGKSLVLGQSQLDGCGYGLFTVEDIAEDEFVIEYVGELITHDEGVRREARRGNVFDEESNVSYVFTLLDNEGIWIDGAIYGNLSRYINHASEHDKRGCNIIPRILYVNGEYRIKFTALRDIKAGEELFFNYGENFPNLTKKLLDHKAAENPDTKSGPAKTHPPEKREAITRSYTKAETKRRPGRPRIKRDVSPGFALEALASEQAQISRKRKRRRLDDSDRDYASAPADSTLDVEEGGRNSEVPGSASRLRTRITARGEKPTKHSGQYTKTRGNRGGRRPGSGRPRKHPPPIPTPATTSESKSEEPVTSDSNSTPAATAAASLTLASTSTWTESIDTTKPKHTIRSWREGGQDIAH